MKKSYKFLNTVNIFLFGYLNKIFIKSSLSITMIITFTVANAQIKKEMVITKDVKVVTGQPALGKKPKNIGNKDQKFSEQINKGAILTQNQTWVTLVYPALETTLSGTKIKTRVSPSNTVKLSTPQSKKPKPKDKGTKEDDGRICRSYSISLSPDSESFDAPLADKMAYTYPGAAYNYNDYIKNNVQPMHNKSARNPIILQASSASGNGKQILVEDPTKNNLDQTVGQLKYALPRQANNLSTEVYVQTIVNDASFSLNVQAGGGGFGFDVNANFGLNYSSNKTFMSIDAKQKNFIITANRPDRADSGFYKDATENAKNENVYMSSVTYGRRVIGVIETELDEKHMEVGVKASYEGFGVSANLGLGIIDKMSSGKTTVRLLYIGGKADVITIPNPTAASVQATINQWMANTNTQAAVPIEYTFRNMKDIGMRWESVASNINYEQCVPKPPVAVVPQPWDISVKLNSISNNKREGVKLGVQQFVGVQVNNEWKHENSGQDKPIICWMQDWSGCQTPPEIDFRSPYQLGTTYNYTVNNDEYNQNPLFRVDTKRIVTYRTSVGGSKNSEVNIPKYDVRLKDMGYSKTFDVPVHINGRIFKFNYTVSVLQRRP